MTIQNYEDKVVVIVGQTASGKSDLAVTLAKKFGGEVISADSRQVYKGLNIGTGKITQTEMRGVRHHLLDVANLKTRFTAADFVCQARKVIIDISSRGKLPIIAGGTMFYIDALLGDVHIPEVPPNEQLRKDLEQRGEASLLEELQKLDPKRAKAFIKDGQSTNKRRIIRAIEVAKTLSSVSQVEQWSHGPLSRYEVLKIGIMVDKEILRERIKLRTTGRMKAGMVSEVRKLHKKGLTYKRMRNLGLEYGHLADYLQNRITKEELIWRIERDDWRYAKKQLAWWKRDESIKWLGLSELKDVEKLVEDFIKT